VITAPGDPNRVMTACKAFATKRLRQRVSPRTRSSGLATGAPGGSMNRSLLKPRSSTRKTIRTGRTASA